MRGGRSQWGKHEWTGPWSDGSAEWDNHPKVKALVKPKDDVQDGTFWMAWEDFARVFTSIDICARSTGLRDLHLNAFESDGRARYCGPTLGCLLGCASFWCCLQGCRALYCNQPAEPKTLHVDASSSTDDNLLGELLDGVGSLFRGPQAEPQTGQETGTADDDAAPSTKYDHGTAAAAGASASSPPSPSTPGVGAVRCLAAQGAAVDATGALVPTSDDGGDSVDPAEFENDAPGMPKSVRFAIDAAHPPSDLQGMPPAGAEPRRPPASSGAGDERAPPPPPTPGLPPLRTAALPAISAVRPMPVMWKPRPPLPPVPRY